jgi:hypothetical protein
MERGEVMEGIGKRDGMKKLRAPFPFFGGKSLIAREVWSRLGDVGDDDGTLGGDQGGER